MNNLFKLVDKKVNVKAELERAARLGDDLEHVVIVGVRKGRADEMYLAHTLDGAQTVWMLEQAKLYLLTDNEE